RSGGLLFCSGQVPIDPATGSLVEGSIGDQARQCLENLTTVCAQAGVTLADAVRMSIYVTDISTFAQVNEVYGSDFQADPPARRPSPPRRPAPRRASPRPRAARRSRWTRSPPCPTAPRVTMAPAPGRTVEPADIARARVAVADIVRQTPVLPSLTLSEHTGAEV